MEIKPLAQLAVGVLHEAFLDAFSDYEVPLDLPMERFREMMRIRDLNPKYSLGCFDGERLVSFILCGFRQNSEGGICYDGGTGTVRDYRKKGIGNQLLSEQISFLKEKGVRRFVLEVMENNRPAIDLYRKHEFETTRRFECFAMNKTELPDITPPPLEIGTAMSDFLSLDPLPFMDYAPSWQNEKRSVENAAENFESVSLLKDGSAVAYGLVHKQRGDIPQLGVLEPYRGKGLEAVLLQELKQRTASEKLVFLNVEEKSDLAAQLWKLGFHNHVNQYEMQRIL